MSEEPAAPRETADDDRRADFELVESSGVGVAPRRGSADVRPGRRRRHHARPSRPRWRSSCSRKISLFSALQPPTCAGSPNLGIEEDYPLGAVIFKEGEQGDKFYLILSGAVRISRQVPGMGEEALAVLRAGTHFGEMALIDDFPRSADAVAHEACRLFVVRKEDMEDLLFVDRDLAYDLLWIFVRTLSSRLRETNDKMTFMAVTSKF